MFSNNAINGKTKTPEPIFVTISKNSTLVPLFTTLNSGIANSGKPAGILPVKTNK